MATALFQCVDNGLARNMERCLPVAPVKVLDFKTFGDLACIIFAGDCPNMYWWSMDIAGQSPHTCAFIGIDEQCNYADDKYKLTILTSDSYKSKQFRDCYVELVEMFMNAALHMSLTDAQLWQICSQCMLGSSDTDLVEHIVASIRICANQGRQINYRQLMCCTSEGFRVSVRRDTTVRVMAHICYLDSVIRPNASKTGGLLRFLFGR